MAAKNKKRRGKSGIIFYPVYWMLVLLGCAAILLMMRVLWDNMADYEASMPKYVAQEVEKIFDARDFGAMYDLDDTTVFAAEGKEAYVEYMQRLTSGQEITCRESYSANPDEKVYKILSGGKKLGTYTLMKSGEKTDYGNEKWMLKEIRTSIIEPSAYRITVPESSSVYADGQLLDPTAIVESGLELTTGYLPEGYAHEKWCTYSVERCFGIPEFDVKDSRGRDQVFMPSAEGRLTARLNSDDAEIKPLVEERVIKTARAFSQFTSDDCSTHTVMKYIKEGSKAEKYIRGFDGGWFLEHRGFDYENMRTENYTIHSENVFSCSVYFDYIIKYKKVTEVYPTAYTFFFEKVGEEWLMFDFTIAG